MNEEKKNYNTSSEQEHLSQDNTDMLKEPVKTAEEENTDSSLSTNKETTFTDSAEPTPTSSLDSQIFNTTDKDLLTLKQLPKDEWLWYFIDDVIPTPQKDTEILLTDQGTDDNGMPMFTMIPKSLEILEMVRNAPNHAAHYYPGIVKFFPIIQDLYNNVIIDEINPYWAAAPIHPPDFNTLHTIFTMFVTGKHAYLSLTPTSDSIPCRLIYGDLSHKHDYVGIVHMHL